MQNRSQHHFNLWFVLKIDPVDGWQLIYAIINSSIFPVNLIHWVYQLESGKMGGPIAAVSTGHTVKFFSHVKKLMDKKEWKNLESVDTDLWTWQYNINCPCCPCWNCVSKNVAMEGNAKNPDSPVGRFSRLAACTILAVNEQLVKHWKADNFQMCGWHLKMKDITMDYGL